MVYDSIVIGAGPAGLTVANDLVKNGMTCRVFEKGAIADHILRFPVFMQFFSSSEFLELDEFPLTIPDEKPTRRQYLTYLTRFVRSRNLPVDTYTTVEHVEKRDDGSFQIEVVRLNGRRESFLSRSVVAACGAYERPHRIGVPGEELPHVSHHFTEVHPYYDRSVLVVGGRNSAIETALLLYRSGVKVSLAFRANDLSESSIKYWLRPDIDARIEKGQIPAYPGSTIGEIRPGEVELTDCNGRRVSVDADFVLLLTGYEPPLGFLKKIGVPFQDGSPVPIHNPETLETANPGLFVAGVITAGNISGKVFIENSRHHGELIVKRLLELRSN